MGTLFKRDDRYYANFIDRSGKRQRAALHTTDRKVALARLRELELATTDRAAHQTEALDAALTYYLSVACAAKPDGTIRSYSQKARHVSRLLGGTLADKLNREGVERYIAARLEEGAHPHSVHKELVVLRGALRSAAERDRFHGSIEAVVPKFDAEYEPRRTYLTPEQFMTLTDNICRPIGAKATEAQRARHEARKVRRTLYVLLIALASPRVGEVEAMQWEHVDLFRGVIVVPKGKTVARAVKLHPVLRLWLERYAQEAGPIVEPWGNVSRDLPRLCERAGIPRCTPNDLRRTFASWLVQSGETLHVVARLLGHKSTRMVELVYGQLDEATLSRAIARMPGGDWDAIGTHDRASAVTSGHGEANAVSAPTANIVEKPTKSDKLKVPRVGIEPTTRGFSVPLPNRDNPPRRKVKLRAV